MSRPLKQISGLRYGRLVVIERVGRTKHYLSTWRCICDCGNEITVISGNLHTGNTTNCGCERNKKSGARIGAVAKLNIGNKNPFWGKKHTANALRLMSIAQTGRVGKNAANWQGGITSLNNKIRNSKEYAAWRISVFERDDYTCQNCGQRGGKLNADHIKPFAVFHELRFSLENGRTLCISCHIKTDTYAGRSQKRPKRKDTFVFAIS